MQKESGQSAIEFLMTYSYAFLIITISVAVLLLFFSLPKTIIPFQCNFYSGFTCTDSVLVNTSNGASLIVVGLDGQPGTVNISTFNAILDYRSDYIGYCLPSSAVDGQYVYCIANFSFTPLYTNVYYGTFNMSANYCANLPQNLTVQKCPASNSFIYSGNLRVQAVAQSTLTSTLNALIGNSPALAYYMPIVLTNTQPAPTAAPYQQPLSFPSSLYRSYIHPAWNNVEFSTLPDGRGTVLEAWIETSPLNTVGNTLVWVNLPRGIPANSSVTIYANFMAGNIMSASGPTGEEASLSTTYAEYDNGAYVFDMYDNFNGTTLSSLWQSPVGAVTVDNGLTITTSGGYIQSASTYTPLNNVFELNWSAITVTSYTANYIDFGFNSLNVPTTNALYWEIYAATTAITANTVTSHSLGNSGNAGNYMYSLTINTTNAIGITTQPGKELTPKKVVSTAMALYPGSPTWLYVQNQAGTGNTLYVYWVRIRGAPPDNTYPSATYGVVAKVT